MNIPNWVVVGVSNNFECRVRKNKEDSWRYLRPVSTNSAEQIITKSIAVGETADFECRFLLDVPVGDYEIEVGLANPNMNIWTTDSKRIEVTKGEVDVKKIFRK
jgi:hypothetical protein